MEKKKVKALKSHEYQKSCPGCGRGRGRGRGRTYCIVLYCIVYSH